MNYIDEALRTLSEDTIERTDMDNLLSITGQLQLVKNIEHIIGYLTDNDIREIKDTVKRYLKITDGSFIRAGKSDEQIEQMNSIENELITLLESLVEKYRNYVLNSNTEVKINDDNLKIFFYQYIAKMDDNSIIRLSGLKTSDELCGNEPMFVLKDGRIIRADIQQNKRHTHLELFHDICENIFNALFKDRLSMNFSAYSLYSQMDFMTTERGWMRLNPITSGYEDRFYCVLPDKEHITAVHYDKLMEFMDIGSIKTNKVSIYAGKYFTNHIYFFDNHTTDEIIGDIKRFYSTGYFVESSKQAHRATKPSEMNILSQKDETCLYEPKKCLKIDSSNKLNEENTNPSEKDVINAIENMENDDDETYIAFDVIASNRPVVLVSPNGEVIDASAYDTHDEFLTRLFKDYLDDDDEYAYSYITQILGFITLNTGQGLSEDRCKIVIDSNSQPTDAQYDIIEQWIKRRESDGTSAIIVYCRGEQKSYIGDEMYAEYIIKSIKKSFLTGMLEHHE